MGLQSKKRGVIREAAGLCIAVCCLFTLHTRADLIVDLGSAADFMFLDISENQAMDAMRDELSRLPGVQYEFSRPALLSFASPLQIEISGYDLDSLARVSNAVVADMSASDRFADIRTTVERGNPEIQIIFDQERTAKLGLAVRDIANRVDHGRGEIGALFDPSVER